MKDLLYNISKKVLFKMDPEFVHDGAINFASKVPSVAEFLTDTESFNSKRFGLNVGNSRWHFPVGLAAGMDKNCQAVKFFANIGFGAVEVGTVTPLPQPGNERPRLFRYIQEESVRNCMGFNNVGSDDLLVNLLRAKKEVFVPIGVNLGKNKLTEDAVKDYLLLFNKFKNVSDYLVLNFSSPNTPGLRDLQQIDKMREILQELKGSCFEFSSVDLFVKISPDLDLKDISDIVKLVKEFDLAGIIATNTTIMPDMGGGGVSGKMLRTRSEKIRFHILDELKECPETELIGVGGISCFDDIWRFWKRGGRSVQILTSLIFGGPAILNSIRIELESVLNLNNMSTVEELLQNIDRALKRDE